MPPKPPKASKASSKAAGSAGQVHQQQQAAPSAAVSEEVLSAVVLADSFNFRFQPLSMDQPRCLFPLCNRPLLSWTLDALSSSGIQDVYLFMSSHSSAIKTYIQQSEYNSSSSSSAVGMRLIPLVVPTARSAGDVMRELDQRALLNTDFVLISSDVVCTLDISKAIQSHKERKLADKHTVMTVCMKKTGGAHPSRNSVHAPLLLLNATESNRILHIESISHTLSDTSNPKKSVKNVVPYELLEKHPDLQIRNDLMECGIDIFSPEAVSLFSENYDYTTLPHLIRGVTTSDLYGHTIYAYIIPDTSAGSYAGRVRDTRSYAAVSSDIISRWTFPLVLDERAGYELRSGLRYVAKDVVVLHRTSDIGPMTVLGPYCKIDAGTSIAKSVLGERVIVGLNSTIKNSFLWDGVIIGNNVTIQDCIIAQGAVIKENVTLEKGCVIGREVKIGPGIHLAAMSRVSRHRYPVSSAPSDEMDSLSDNESLLEHDAGNEYEETPEEAEKRVLELGQDSCGRIWPSLEAAARAELESDSESDASDEENPDLKDHIHSRIGFVTPKHRNVSEHSFSTISALSSPTISASSDDASSLKDIADLNLNDDISNSPAFLEECNTAFQRIVEENISAHNSHIDLQALRMHNNVKLIDVARVLIQFCLRKLDSEASSAGERQESIQEAFGRWLELIRHLVGEDEGPQSEATVILQKYFGDNVASAPYFGSILTKFYMSDIITQESIEIWLKLPQSRTADMKSTWDVGKGLWEKLAAMSDSEEESE